ncbi:MAG: exodeoxyribonuclease VII small subunit [Candidatus Latescibacteria bacterium]|nr:exodeoxyribonuclease VII small subunit [Candidatus Latescibacterota bacterium]NIM21519.1 exodeoxyribonuclease VII small subunit [Candidatus Latescibacterota bacterium]NIM65690.1 exodeoxyribonuclease VII small subunit [Candidatus Latescibacterota bacterium]NIO02072.1 exodeoxyribonuclease VII small subunit [Candidatus Latescibacterota bacterium]NIO28884.1 exodeoxyribonuclease VII small subunit [Candidatus Latescibacterota bacterium]
MAKGKLSFEEALARLEKIVAELEKGDFTLEESLKKFEEGLVLGKECREFLDKAEGRIRELVEEKEGQITEKDVTDEF